MDNLGAHAPELHGASDRSRAPSPFVQNLQNLADRTVMNAAHPHADHGGIGMTDTRASLLPSAGYPCACPQWAHGTNPPADGLRDEASIVSAAPPTAVGASARAVGAFYSAIPAKSAACRPHAKTVVSGTWTAPNAAPGVCALHDQTGGR